jgi:hypothetical protein
MRNRLLNPGVLTVSCTGLAAGFRASYFGRSFVLGEHVLVCTCMHMDATMVS